MIRKELISDIPGILADNPAVMQARWVTVDEGRLLRELVRSVDPDFYLESGTANGYSTLWGISGLKSHAQVYTFDPVNRAKIWELIPALKNINVNAVTAPFCSLPTHVQPKGKIVVFIDGDHGQGSVLEDFRTIKPFLKSGDLVIFHDMRERNVIKAKDTILAESPPSRYFRFPTQRAMGVMYYNTQTLPIGAEENEPIVIRIPSLIKSGTEKVRDTKWAQNEKPWTEYEYHSLHSSSELQYLYETAKRLGAGNYANLGVFKGKSTACLAFGLKAANANGTIYAVDTYDLENLTEYPDKMMARLNEFGLDHYVKVCKGTTARWATKLSQLSFKFILIDAGHKYRDAKEDFDMWSPLLEIGGELAIHDCDYMSVHKMIEEELESKPDKWEMVEHVWRSKTFRKLC